MNSIDKPNKKIVVKKPDSIEIISGDFYELDFLKKENGYYISIKEDTSVELFYHRCDSFINGRYIQRLRIAIESYKKNKNRIIMSSWYPKLHAIFLLPVLEFPYIDTTLYSKGDSDLICFKVYYSKNSTPIVFTTSLKNIDNFIN